MLCMHNKALCNLPFVLILWNPHQSHSNCENYRGPDLVNHSTVYCTDRTLLPIFFFGGGGFITPEGFTTAVANEGLEKARAYLNQVPRDRRLYISCGVNFRWKHVQPIHLLTFFGQS